MNLPRFLVGRIFPFDSRILFNKSRHNIATAMPNYHSVPPISQIRPMTPVSIILKQDQRSGRQVTGYVNEILTRGDHPRGVKVRLRDGRVGRVQAVISSDLVEKSLLSSTTGEGGSSTQHDACYNDNREGRTSNRRFGMGKRGKRDNEYANLAQEAEPKREYDLSVFVKEGRFSEKKGKSRGGKSGERTRDELPRSEILRSEAKKEEKALTCPVCGLFEGDERAVEWHVGTHFEA
ncbi:hypothetical protein K7432_013935 [Basidiobolus ranarum]|uniref:Uncharacterized protein n=1 Tax=Basidiobolus ranarum TaxID=34480 RepID=A0ABR2VQ43_9FUNG